MEIKLGTFQIKLYVVLQALLTFIHIFYFWGVQMG